MRFRSVLSIASLSLLVSPVVTHATWTINGVPVCTTTGQQSNHAMVSDGAGGAIIAWQDERGASIDIYAQRIDAQGVVQWTANGVALCVASDDQSGPVMASDGAGGAIVAWQDYRNGVDADVYVQRINAVGSVKWAANGVLACSVSGSQYNPAVTGDGSGGAIVAWEDVRSTDSDIYVQRINLLGVIQWTAGGVALCTAAHDQYINAIAYDVPGVAVVVWDDLRNGVDLDVYAQRINSGSVSWAANGVPLCTVANDQDAAVLIPDGATGMIAAWEDIRSGTNYDVYAQRLNKSGQTLWTANGVALCTAADDQTLPAIAPDGAAGAIVAWNDNRLTLDSDIYAQRVIGAGTVAWTGNGIGVCTVAGSQGGVSMAADADNGAIISWDDVRSGNYDVYAQRINQSGAALWAAGGITVVSKPGQQSGSVMSSESGGAILAWRDFQTDVQGDLYALRITAGGSVPSAVQGASPALSMAVSENYPNPFSGITTFDLTLRRAEQVGVEIFDVTGRRVRALDVGHLRAGASTLSFNGLDDRARELPSGVYFIRVRAAGETVVRKMVIAR